MRSCALAIARQSSTFWKKTRDDAGYWQAVECFIEQRTEAEFSHGICPACMQQHSLKQK